MAQVQEHLGTRTGRVYAPHSAARSFADATLDFASLCRPFYTHTLGLTLRLHPDVAWKCIRPQRKGECPGLTYVSSTQRRMEEEGKTTAEHLVVITKRLHDVSQASSSFYVLSWSLGFLKHSGRSS